ncbi:MAG: efflux RND transporter permease subunit, partial [Planctomycetota bacterium]
MIRWFANNGIAANFLMVGILLAGLYTAFFRVPLEVVPTRQYNVVYIEMPYRGATARDVERSILIPIENALQGVDGVKMLHTDGMRGRGRIWIESKDGYDPRVLMEDVRSRIDGITTFPAETEEPRIRVPDSSQWTEVLKVAVTGQLPA